MPQATNQRISLQMGFDPHCIPATESLDDLSRRVLLNAVDRAITNALEKQRAQIKAELHAEITTELVSLAGQHASRVPMTAGTNEVFQTDRHITAAKKAGRALLDAAKKMYPEVPR